MRVLLLQLDGKLPNLALMRISSHHKALGDEVEFRRIGNPTRLQPGLFDEAFDLRYASLIFSETRPLAERLLELYPDAIVGGTGLAEIPPGLEMVGITTTQVDYSLYPEFKDSIGYTQRGCRLDCAFCRMRTREGPPRSVATIAGLYRGEPYPRHLHLLDNDFFGQNEWRDRLNEIREGKFKVSFSQGINARMITEEVAAELGTVQCYDDGFKTRRIYTAWDNMKDEERLFAGLRLLKDHGFKPDEIMVYLLVGFWPGETQEDRLYRQRELREFGCRPYPLIYHKNKTAQLTGFKRWCVGAYDKRISWTAWERAGYQPCNLGYPDAPRLSLDSEAWP